VGVVIVCTVCVLVSRGIEWIHQNACISYASSNSTSSVGVRNEVAVVDIQNGMWSAGLLVSQICLMA